MSFPTKAFTAVRLSFVISEDLFFFSESLYIKQAEMMEDSKAESENHQGRERNAM